MSWSGDWWFAPLTAGTTAASGLNNLLTGSKLSQPEMFVREVTQNSVDARLLGRAHPVEVFFRSKLLDPSQQRHLRSLLAGKGKLTQHLSAMVNTQPTSAEALSFEGMLSNPHPWRVLIVEDYGTHGLGGQLGANGPEDHFSKLVYFFGQTWTGDSTKGGAFGFGKSVYSTGSKVRTVVYYSRPANGKPSRLIAVSLLPGHSLNGTSYLGYGICGLGTADANFPVHPYEGHAADLLAESIGFNVRSEEESGTSIMVLNCDYSAESLKGAIEKWWWPRIVTTGGEGLRARFFHDGRELNPPNPVQNQRLQPFVQSFRHFLDGGEDSPDTKSYEVRTKGNRVLGKLILKRIDVAPAEEVGEDEISESWHYSSVAMFRGPRLVVNYSEYGTKYQTPFVGVFAAAEDIDSVLRKSENPAHTNWDPDSSRLLAENGEPFLVKAVARRCRQLASDFQKSFERSTVARFSQIHVLQDILGRLMVHGSSPGGLPPGDERPVELSVKQRRNLDEAYDEAVIEIGRRQPGDDLPARLQVSALLLGDANRSKIGEIPIEIFDDAKERLASGLLTEHTFDVPGQGKVRFFARATLNVSSPIKFVVKVAGREV